MGSRTVELLQKPWPLHAATLEGASLAEVLPLAQICNVNAKVPVSPLFLACTMGDLAMAQRLFHAGARLTDDQAVLAQAMSSNCDSETKCIFIEILVTLGADIDHEDECGMRPLKAALASSSIDVLKRLIERGASAFEGGERLLLRRLRRECQKGDLETIEGLLAIGPSVTKRDWITTGLFHTIVGQCDADVKLRVAKQLVANGADVNYVTGDITSLHVACGHEDMQLPNPDVARLLLESGACANARLRNGRTPLHILCAADYDYFAEDEDEDEDEEEGLARFNSNVIECIKLLLEHGADLDACDDEGNVPFVLAIINGKTEIIDFLLEHQKPYLASFDDDDSTAIEGQ